jgi:thiamine-phosphate pyrophosphorylase
VLDYVGVGPLRFTATKQALAPVLGAAGVQALIEAAGGLPAWVIGGVEASDLPSLRLAGAAGVAVSSALFRGGDLEKNLESFTSAWSK